MRRHRKRLHQFLLIGTFLPWCLLAMMAVHELGHVLAARLTGGKVTNVVLHPLAISRTDVSPNPAPLVVVWAGPIIGVLVPLALLVISRLANWQAHFLTRFLAGFCLIANGAYVAFGSWSGAGDAGDMLRAGTPIWCLWLFGVITIPPGLALWHGLGPHFGLGEACGAVSAGAAYLSLVLLVLTVALELLLGR